MVKIDDAYVRKLLNEYGDLKHGEWEDHKYVAKVEVKNNKFRYFYDNMEYQRYLRQKNIANDLLSETNINGLVGDIARSTKDVVVSGTKAFTRWMNEGKNKNLSNLAIKDKNYTKNEDMALSNPKYDPEVPEYSMNCASCSAAYEMRRRGYDVEARPYDMNHEDATNGEIMFDVSVPVQSNILKWYDGEQLVKSSDLYAKYNITGPNVTDKQVHEIIEKELLSYGNDARGQLHVTWRKGGAHSVVWEIHENTVIIRDCQSNTVHSLEYYTEFMSDFSFFRTDNVQINEKIAWVVKNRERR